MRDRLVNFKAFDIHWCVELWVDGEDIYIHDIKDALHICKGDKEIGRQLSDELLHLISETWIDELTELAIEEYWYQ